MISYMGMVRRLTPKNPCSLCISSLVSSSHPLGSSPFPTSSPKQRLYSSESSPSPSLSPSSPISPNRLSILRDKLKDVPMLSDFVKTQQHDHIHHHSSSSHQDHIEDHLQSSPGDLFTFERTSNLHMDYTSSPSSSSLPLAPPLLLSKSRKFFVETYGCQMNFSDTEIVNSIMTKAGYDLVEEVQAADVILINTCAIRENAEQKVWGRLQEFRAMKLSNLKRRKEKDSKNITIGVLGCMAERLKTKLLESDRLVDVVVGPDAYRDLPRLISTVEDENSPTNQQQKAINVLLSADETYADIAPVRAANSISAFVSIMRGCNNMCSYCIVPFTRGRERSRPFSSIQDEVLSLADQGFKEIILLGQNVNSFNDISPSPSSLLLPPKSLAKGFRQIASTKELGMSFAELLHRLAPQIPEVRLRFTSPHPKDFPDDLLHVIKEHPNICNSIHIPAQSGSSSVLDRMRRGYTREAYLELIARIKEMIPNCGLSSDFISGFCGETEQDHQETLSMLRQVGYDTGYMFAYSVREKTHAHRTLDDDVPQEVKLARLKEVIELFYSLAEEKNKTLEKGKKHLVLIEKASRRSNKELMGRTDTNKKVLFPDIEVSSSLTGSQSTKVKLEPGDFVVVEMEAGNSTTLRGKPLARSSITEWKQQSLV